MRGFKKVKADFFQESEAKHLSEIYGHGTDMPEYAVVAASGKQIGTWMRCKDYIQDTIWGSKNDKSYSIYGWSYKCGKDLRPSSRWLILALRWKKQKNLSAYLDNVKLTIERLEKKLKIPKTSRTHFSEVIDDKFIIWGSPHWMRCIATVSFFTFLVRASLYNTSGRFEDIEKQKKWPVGNDAYYCKSGQKFIKKLMEEGFAGFKPDWDKHTQVGNVHNNGFVGFSSGM